MKNDKTNDTDVRPEVTKAHEEIMAEYGKLTPEEEAELSDLGIVGIHGNPRVALELARKDEGLREMLAELMQCDRCDEKDEKIAELEAENARLKKCVGDSQQAVADRHAQGQSERG